MRVDIDQYGLVAPLPALTGDGIDAALQGIFIGNRNGDLFRSEAGRLSKLLGLSGEAQPGLRDVKFCADGQDDQQAEQHC